MSGVLMGAAASAATLTGPPPSGGGGPLTVVVQPNPCTGVEGNAPGFPGQGLIEHAFAVLTGGFAPFTYLWQWWSGTPADLWGFTDPTQPEVWWSFNGPDHKEAVYKVTVTDGHGSVQEAFVTIIAN